MVNGNNTNNEDDTQTLVDEEEYRPIDPVVNMGREVRLELGEIIEKLQRIRHTVKIIGRNYMFLIPEVNRLRKENQELKEQVRIMEEEENQE
jgi:hypothetical protein